MRTVSIEFSAGFASGCPDTGSVRVAACLQVSLEVQV